MTCAEAGLNLVVTESDGYDARILDDARAAGLQFWGGLGCFTSQTSEGNVLERRPHLWPILATGRRRPQMEWYNGVIPTDPAYNDARISLAADLMSEFEFDGFVSRLRALAHALGAGTASRSTGAARKLLRPPVGPAVSRLGGRRHTNRLVSQARSPPSSTIATRRSGSTSSVRSSPSSSSE